MRSSEVIGGQSSRFPMFKHRRVHIRSELKPRALQHLHRLRVFVTVRKQFQFRSEDARAYA